MSSKTILLTLIFILFLSACDSASRDPQPATVTPDIMPRLDPSPTLSNSKLPLTCQVTDLNVFINEADGYCFAYPLRFTSESNAGVRGPALDDSLEVFATFNVEVTPAAADQTLRGQAEVFLKGFSVVDSGTFTWSQVQVGGEAGWMVEPIPALASWRMVFVQHHDYLFRLSYWPVDIPIARADIDELTQTTLGSFAFTK